MSKLKQPKVPRPFELDYPEAAAILQKFYVLGPRFLRYSIITRRYGFHYLPEDIIL
jgi:hypothetical protein